MTFRGFERQVSFQPSGVEGKLVAAEFAAFARAQLDSAVSEGVGSPNHLRVVNGQQNAPEADVTVPGPIVYLFDWIREATIFALEDLRRHAPVYSGRYRKSFFVMADGRQIDPAAIPLGTEVVITNDQPYSRKIQVGSEGFEYTKGLFEATRASLLREFKGVIKAQVMFVELQGGYILKGTGFRGRRVRPDRRAGQAMTYPSLAIWTPLSTRGGLA